MIDTTPAAVGTSPGLSLHNADFERLASPFVEAGVLRAEEVAVVDAVAPRWSERDPEVLLALALAWRAPRVGHVGVDLLRVRRQVMAEEEGRHGRARQVPEQSARHIGKRGHEIDDDEPSPWEQGAWPKPRDWQQRVLRSPLVGGLDDDPTHPTPFACQPIEDEHWLVMARRFAREQQRVAEAIRRLHLSAPKVMPRDAAQVDRTLDTLFPDAPEAKRAARTTLERALTLITGGPGTGKTYSVTRTLTALLATVPREPPLRIALAAPTGKAAVRMREAILENLTRQGTAPGQGSPPHRSLPTLVAPRGAIVHADSHGSLPSSQTSRGPTGKDVAPELFDKTPHDPIQGGSIPSPAESGRQVDGDAPGATVTASILGQLEAMNAQTLHALLGIAPDGSVRRNQGHPLPVDVVLVDEVSMVDLVTMRMLLEAIPGGARLILLGDPDQLASVEAGTVLSDLVEASSAGALDGALVRFTKNRRFEDAPSIGKAAQGIQARCSEGLEAGMKALTEGAGIRWVQVRKTADGGNVEVDTQGVRDLVLPFADAQGNVMCAHLAASTLERLQTHRAGWDEALDALVLPYLAPRGYVDCLVRALGDGKTPDEQTVRAILDALGSYRVLAVHRRGRRGVSSLNRALEERLRRAFPDALVRTSRGGHWVGEVLLITRNAYDIGLRNGDVGLVMPTPRRSGQRSQQRSQQRAGHLDLAACFPKGSRDVGCVPLGRLPPHEPGFAMTVHKSQGSQFERVALMLAPEPCALQSRELVYTAITRARKQLDWYGEHGVMQEALQSPIQRASGLRELLSPLVDRA